MTESNSKTDQLRKLEMPSFKVDSKKYKTPTLNWRNGKMMLGLDDIKDLDKPLIEEPGLFTLSLQFPFKHPYGTALQGNGDYITIRDIIDTIRSAYKNLYRNLTSFPCDIEKADMYGDLYELTYPLECLHVEGIYYCSERKVVKVDTKGNPRIRKGPDIPF